MNTHRSARSALAGASCLGSLIVAASALPFPAEAQTKFKYDKETYAQDSKRGYALPNVYGDAKEKEWNALKPTAGGKIFDAPVRAPNSAPQAQPQQQPQSDPAQTARRAPAGYDLLMGHARSVKLVGVQMDYSTPGAIGILYFETPFFGPRGQKWVGYGCGMKAADHPYLLEAFRHGHIVGVESMAESSCVTTYSVQRNDAAQAPAASAPNGPDRRSEAAPPRNANVAVAPQPSQPQTHETAGAQQPRQQSAGAAGRAPAGDAPFSSVDIRTSALTLTGSGASADIAAGFDAVSLRTAALTLTGTGVSSNVAADFTPHAVRTGALTLTGSGAF